MLGCKGIRSIELRKRLMVSSERGPRISYLLVPNHWFLHHSGLRGIPTETLNLVLHIPSRFPAFFFRPSFLLTRCIRMCVIKDFYNPIIRIFWSILIEFVLFSFSWLRQCKVVWTHKKFMTGSRIHSCDIPHIAVPKSSHY